jgi:NAD(P)-dependent dehydrogenase (short-subunit alcohol dehydrogenase family)
MEEVALVTGSTNNIGKAIAEVLAGKGFHVIVTSRHGEEARTISEKLPKKGSYVAVDFSQASSIESLFAFVREKFGRLDVLVNNVAYTKNESILDCDLDT